MEDGVVFIRFSSKVEEEYFVILKLARWKKYYTFFHQFRLPVNYLIYYYILSYSIY